MRDCVASRTSRPRSQQQLELFLLLRLVCAFADVYAEPQGDVDSGMYCPRCGTQASQTDTKFCRGCGADLALVTQAMAGQISWRSHLMNRLDNFFLSRREFEERESAREGGWNIFLGTTLLLISVASLLTSTGGTPLWIVLLLFSLVSLKIGIGNLRLYKRYRQGRIPPEVRPNKDDLTLLKIDSNERAVTSSANDTNRALPSSVTEKTTDLLNEKK